jgi:2'-5' RNA ligase
MSKITRALVFFPKFENILSIEQLRSQYDPLAEAINPHITLVFPFESDLSSNVIHTHIKHAVQGIKPFQIQLQGITGSKGEYLFLNVKIGNDQIIELHDRLYRGLFESYKIKEHTYIPHLTIGRLNDRADYLSALEITLNFKEIFNTLIRDLALIQVGDDYRIEASCELARQSGSQR